MQPVSRVDFANSSALILEFTAIYIDNFPGSRGEHSDSEGFSQDPMTVIAFRDTEDPPLMWIAV